MNHCRTANASEYLSEKGRCAVCHHTGRRWALHVHHLSGRRHPQHDTPANLLVLCSRDHNQYHTGGMVIDGVKLPELTAGMLLTAKEGADGWVDVQWLALLRGRKHLGFEPESLPEFYLTERRVNERRR